MLRIQMQDYEVVKVRVRPAIVRPGQKDDGLNRFRWGWVEPGLNFVVTVEVVQQA